MAFSKEKENLSYLQYRNLSAVNFNTADYVNMPMDGNTDSKNTEGKFSKPNNTDIVCNFDGWAKMTMKLHGSETGFVTDALILGAIFVNDTIIPTSQCTCWMDDDDEATGFEYSVIWPVVNGDIINFRVNSFSGQAINIPANVFLGRVELKSEN